MHGKREERSALEFSREAGAGASKAWPWGTGGEHQSRQRLPKGGEKASRGFREFFENGDPTNRDLT